MLPAFWVYLSTVVFLGILFFKAYKKIIAHFSNQQDAIKLKLEDAEEAYQKALDLYESYREKIEVLELESEKILDKANHRRQEVLDKAEVLCQKIATRKKLELQQRLDIYGDLLKQKLVSHLSDSVIIASKKSFEAERGA